jgi:hypothetical protein
MPPSDHGFLTAISTMEQVANVLENAIGRQSF